MNSTKEKVKKGLSENAGKCALQSTFENLKRIDWGIILVTLSVGVIAFLVTDKLKTVLTIVYLLFYALRAFKKMGKTSEHLPKSTIDKSLRNLLFIAALILPPASRDAALGDMLEIYKKDVKRLRSQKLAKCVMCVDILRSAYPLAKYLTRSIVIRALKAIGAYELYRRFIGL